MARILFVMTGARHWTLNDGTRHPTGFWAEEAVIPYRALTEAGHEVTVASPGGVVPVPDAASLTPDATGGEEGAEAITAALEEFTELRRPVRLEEVDLAGYDAVFYPGGHGPMEDLAVDADSGRLLTATLDSGKPLALVCHGPAAMLAARRQDGGSPFAGRRLTGFTNEEERQAGLAGKAPWLLQDRLTGLGADFRAGAPWQPNVVVDRNLITGQNPASSGPLVAELLKMLG
ncbi:MULTISPECIES: type 1 glutamine amidotransferase domain-containing protein [Thermomonospora]|uniref:Putative intracellular protease/amidase n=1 Tax=Thermomonospora cellulosilytica TaxID=1411118 RepID=A0A7W3MU33_9ACTN|nr:MULTISPECIES: type 1 glutamine amidotransferase domain-containing protein [Thermomonospora]MBA9001928.1 putative intracellular protease/amidase [Thermomonospora cellulosilytica]